MSLSRAVVVDDTAQSPSGGATPRLWVAYLLLGALLIVGYALAPDRTMQNALYSVLTLLAVTAILVGIRVHRPVSRAPWLLFAAGQLLWAFGDAVEVGYEQLGRELPYPSWADVAYLAAYPVLALGLGLMIISRDRRPDRTRMLDALIVTTGLSLVIWLMIIVPILVTDSGSGSAMVVSVAYPVGDLVLLSAVVVLGTSAAGHTVSVRLLLAALICVVVADTLYSAVPGSSVDALGPSDDRWLEYLWMGSYLFWGASALHPSMTALFLPPSQRQAGPSLTRLLAVAGACALAPLVLVLERGSDLSLATWGLTSGTVVILLLVVTRLWISIGHLSSLTEQRDLFQQELIFLSTRDPLTGLPNRAEGMLYLRVTLGQASEKDVGPAVLVLDLDHLGRVNETYGREAGDEVLRALAIRLSGELGTEGTLSRLGGDRFMAILPGVGDQLSALAIAERLIGSTVRPVPLSVDGEVAIDASVGVALGSGDRGDGHALVRAAERALRRGKAGGGGVAVLAEQSEVTEPTVVSTDRVSTIRRAIANDEFVVVYQPVVSLPQRRVHSFEALVRWQHPDGGLVPPSEFVPVAEASDLIIELDNWMLDAVARQLAAWTGHPVLGDLPVAVNVSGRHVNQTRLVDDVLGALDRHEVSPRHLVLEVTETMPIADGEPVASLHRLRRNGIKISLDDFGTGHNTIDVLARLPLDHVKIDRSFLEASSRARPQLLRLLVEAAGNYRLPLIGEGVEREEQVTMLESLGVGAAQGYLFGRAMPAEDIERFVVKPESFPAEQLLDLPGKVHRVERLGDDS